ncbi:uncharacterized protein [Typha angustifolia]|uniref:uncharacterized protein n=1 Tax=Typha angustifolia TaxID=59011 RepID=UPI003C2DE4D6
MLEANDFQSAINGASTDLLKVSLLSSDLVSTGAMGPALAACPSNLETIFSPNLDSDSQLKPMNHINGDEFPELPHLIADDSDEGCCPSSDFQSCLLDFYFAENVSSFPFDRIMGFTNDVDTIYHEYMDSDMMIDMTERYMLLPFLEKAVERENFWDETSLAGAVMDVDETCLYLAIHQVKPPDEETENCGSGELGGSECFDHVVRDLPDLCDINSSICPIWLPKAQEEKKAITLVLDLDETLVHSTLEYCEDADFTFPVFFNMQQHTVYVRRRPHLQVFLERVAEMFEIVIFTASQSIYAEKLLDILDPEKKLFSQRIYRESCIFSDGSYTKDLTILGVDLAKVAIIDNSPQVFQLQVNNGIPIKSWFDDRSDQALIQLIPFLETLVDADDVRSIIEKKFGNKE